MIAKIISKLKGDSSYKIGSTYSSREWFVILYERGIQILRGFFAKFFLLRTKGICFKGRNVTIKHKALFSSGRNLILEDNVSINALSENGIRFGDNV